MRRRIAATRSHRARPGRRHSRGRANPLRRPLRRHPHRHRAGSRRGPAAAGADEPSPRERHPARRHRARRPRRRVAATSRTYTVRWGDTLSGIAARFGISVERLARANRTCAPRHPAGRLDAAPARRRIGGGDRPRCAAATACARATRCRASPPASASACTGWRARTACACTASCSPGSRCACRRAAARRRRSPPAPWSVPRRSTPGRPTTASTRAGAGGRLAGVRLPHRHPLLGRGVGADAGAPGHVALRRGRADRPSGRAHRPTATCASGSRSCTT